MKQKYSLLAFLLIFALLLCACTPGNGSETDATGDSGLSADQPDRPDDPQPSEEAVTEEERLIAEFDALFGTPGSWHQIALYSEYISVDKLEIRDLFWDGYPGEAPLTDSEYNQVLSQVRDADIADIRRLNVEKVDKVLNSVFGVSFAQMEEYHAVSGIYGLTAESGYMLRGEPKTVENYKTVSVEKQEDGSLCVTYTVGAENTAYVVTVFPTLSGGYRVESNLAVEPKPGKEGYTFVYKGDYPIPDQSEDAIESLYYRDRNTYRVFFVCDGPIKFSIVTDTYVCYIKTDEPNKIYASPKSDFTQHTLIYESEHGEIGEKIYTGTSQFSGKALEFVEGNKRFVWLDLTTGESAVLMEQYYISHASVYDRILVDNRLEYQVVDSWKEYFQVYFVGKLSEDAPMREYLYNMETGKIWGSSTED